MSANEFEKHRRWLEFASTCKHRKEHKFISIPTFLRDCILMFAKPRIREVYTVFRKNMRP